MVPKSCHWSVTAVNPENPETIKGRPNSNTYRELSENYRSDRRITKAELLELDGKTKNYGKGFPF
jgi:hypothetical protein